MKKTFLLAVTALATFLAASCQKEELGRILTATIEQYEHNGKAYINDNYYACWESDDYVRINGMSHRINVSPGNDHNYSATIEGTAGLGGNLLAFYPADRINFDMNTVTLPHLQTYEETTVNGVTRQKIKNPMAAYCNASSDELRFRNLCALLKVTLNTTERVRAIQVKGNDKQMLCGVAPLKLNSQNLPVLGEFTHGSNSVTLYIPEDVTPSSNTFYIVVPSNSAFTQLTIAVLTTDGSTFTHHCKTSPIDQNLARNQIGAFDYTPNGNQDESFFPDWMISYNATEQQTPYKTSSFGDANYLSYGSSFSNGSGYLFFDRPVSMIGDSAFHLCTSLTGISLPESVTAINKCAFQYCTTLSSIFLPEGMTEIGNYAFQYCNALSSISLPANLTSIGQKAFYNCNGLTSITLPPGLTTIEECTFSNCSALGSVTLPASLTTIKQCAFINCSALIGISFPASLTTIEYQAFKYCSTLSTITLPASLTSLGAEAFYGCERLSEVYVNRWESPSTITIGNSGMFGGCRDCILIFVPAGAVGTYKDADGWSEYAGIIKAQQ